MSFIRELQFMFVLFYPIYECDFTPFERKLSLMSSMYELKKITRIFYVRLELPNEK